MEAAALQDTRSHACTHFRAFCCCACTRDRHAHALAVAASSSLPPVDCQSLCMCLLRQSICLCSFLPDRLGFVGRAGVVLGRLFLQAQHPCTSCQPWCFAGHVWNIGCAYAHVHEAFGRPVGFLRHLSVAGGGGLACACEQGCMIGVRASACSQGAHMVRRCSRVSPCCCTQLGLCTQPLRSGKIQNCC